MSSLFPSDLVGYIFKDILFGFLKGFKESLYGVYCIHVYYNQPKSDDKQFRSRVLKPQSVRSSHIRDSSVKKEKELNVRSEIYKCCAYNGVSYGVSVFMFTYVLLYIIRGALHLSLSETNAQDVWDVAQPTLTILFDVFWTVPLFFIFKVINTFWFQDIANSAFRQRHGRPQPFAISGIGNQISDLVFSIVIEVLFLIQATLMQYVPSSFFALILTCIHFSLLNSLYAFEYMWFNKGWTFHRRISYIESNWPYFIGFGFPLSLVTFLLPSFLQSGFVYSVLFPLFIISAMEALPSRSESSGPSLKLFAVVVWLSSVVTKKVFSQDKRFKGAAR